jgi:hypothetical protein
MKLKSHNRRILTALKSVLLTFGYLLLEVPTLSPK